MIQLLDSLFARPLILLCTALFGLVEGLTPDPGPAVIVLSLAVNTILLPLYVQMERKGREARARRAPMDREVARIGGAFRGRERYFYVRTIHRHYGYRPLSALLDTGDLFLQVIVFATVFRFLAALPALQGASFLGIRDLGRPDGLLGGVHLLPLLMTAANVVSVALYSDDRSRRLQGFGLALLFLVLLYDRPAGLVLYWTTSNVYSLLRNAAARWVRAPACLSRWRAAIAEQEG